MATDLTTGALCLLLLSTTCGCFSTNGLLVTYKTEPYRLPHEDRVTVGTKRCSVDLSQLKEPFSGAGLSVMWTNRAVAESMRRAGMTELRYADLQTFSLLNRIYERRRLVFYGE